MIRLSSETWDVTSLFDEAVEKVEEDLDDVDGEPVINEEQGEHGFTQAKSWRFKQFLGLYEQRLVLDYDEGRISTGLYIHSFLWAVAVLVVVLYCIYVAMLPNLTQNIFYKAGDLMFLFYVAASLTALSVNDDGLVDLGDQGVMVSWFANPYPALALIGILLSVFSRFSFLFSPVVSVSIVATMLAGAVFKILVDGYIPREETQVSKLLIIPFQAVFYRLIPFLFLMFISLGPLSLVSGFDVSLSFYSEVGRDTPLVGLASLFSDFTGSFDGSRALATLYSGTPFLVYVSVFAIIFLVGLEHRNCRRLYRYLRNSRIEETDSSIIPVVSAAFFMFSNLLILLLGGLAAAILVYAVTGSVLLPSGSEIVVSTGFYSYIPVEPVNLIRGSLIVIEQSIRVLPLLPTRVYAVAFYSVFFAPLIITGALWTRHIVSLYRQRRSYDDLTSVDIDQVAADVVTVDSQAPIVGPVSTGLDTSILVSRGVIEKLDDAELEAVLRHEEYHIINKDLITNLVASVISIGLGGRNALLAFYGYPGIERSADKYAVEKTGKQTVLSANRKMYELFHSLETEDAGFQGLERLWKPFYQFYFGDFLLGTSHQEYTERNKTISDFGK